MNKKYLLIPIVAVLAAGCSEKTATHAATSSQSTAPAQAAPAQKPKFADITIDGVEGFQDTPMQPDGLWHVHDPARPQPPIVTPKNFSQEAPPPSDAIVLFDGTDLSQWRDKKDGAPCSWTIEDGAAISKKGDIQTTNVFGDIQLHLEFREPTPPAGSGQNRGNSGVFLMSQYEVQVLDCFDNKTYADGATAGLYGQHPPLVNACLPPGAWQTYDIVFTTPHFDAQGNLTRPAYVTVIQNGVVVQNHQAFRGATNWRVPGKYTAHPDQMPLALQFHNNPVAFRNIWVRPITEDNEP